MAIKNGLFFFGIKSAHKILRVHIKHFTSVNPLSTAVSQQNLQKIYIYFFAAIE